MTHALNYTVKAREDFLRLAQTAPNHADRQGFALLVDLLLRAEVFTLPGGDLLDRSKPRPQVPGLYYKPPFPVVALEYDVTSDVASHAFYNAVPAPKRIALAWEWDGRMPGGAVDPAGPKPGEGVVVASISNIEYMPGRTLWMPTAGAVLIPYDCRYERQPETPFRRAMLEIGRIKAKHADVEAVQPGGVMPLLAGAMMHGISTMGQAGFLDTLSADVMDEMNSYLDMCVALACTNVTAERHSQPEKLNRARVKAGKLPLKDFHVLKIGGAAGDAIGGDDGAHGGVRSHLRRGHVRRLGGERVTWVNSCMVRGSKPGFVGKQYAVGEAA